MTSTASTPDAYVERLSADRKPAVEKLRSVIKKNLPKGFEETISYGMVAYVVPHTIYPAGYHCKPAEPLPFVSLASQKGFIALYHMGLYMMPALMDWFTAEWPKHSKSKLDMGKSCIRFKKPEEIPFALIGELTKKVSVKEWIAEYESKLKK